MNVGELRAALTGLRDDILVVVEISRPYSAEEWDDLVQAKLEDATAEIRCDENEVLYLLGEEDPPSETVLKTPDV